MAHDDPAALIIYRQQLRAVAAILAGAMDEDQRARFLEDAERITNRAAPAPGRLHMRNYLKANIID